MKTKTYFLGFGHIGHSTGHFVVSNPSRPLYKGLQFTHRFKGVLSDQPVQHKQFDALNVGDVLSTTTGQHIVVTRITPVNFKSNAQRKTNH